VVVPVTVDRSISEFLLGQLAAHPEERFSAVRARAVFESAYLGEFRQIAQRPAEQTASGEVGLDDEGYVITPQGHAFMKLSEIVAKIFRTDPRMIESEPRTPMPCA
jgi:hypothetical protein